MENKIKPTKIKMENIETTDFGLAITMLCFGGEVLEIKAAPSEDRKKIIVFSGSEKLNNVIENYYINKVRIEPKKFMFNQKTLKSMINPQRAFNSSIQ